MKTFLSLFSFFIAYSFISSPAVPELLITAYINISELHFVVLRNFKNFFIKNFIQSTTKAVPAYYRYG